MQGRTWCNEFAWVYSIHEIGKAIVSLCCIIHNCSVVAVVRIADYGWKKRNTKISREGHESAAFVLSVVIGAD